ncbi:SDR family NAD(P)-dependent oxidoreductase, partial [bacterium]|nr:SDR family NAD(P)-dependent oxidoreductase [bacterium]
MGNRLEEKVALLTGSGQGIGKAIAMAMAKEGARVVINDCEPGIAESAAKEIVDMGGTAVPFVGDISQFDVTQKLIQTTVDNFGQLDILVNNAGIIRASWLWDMTEETWDSVIGVSLKGYFNCIRQACILMKEQRWGRIISASSTSAFGALETAHVCAAKAGVMGLTKAAARELGPYGITCNAYCPTAGTQMTLKHDAKARFTRRYEAGVYTKEKYDSLINPPDPETVPPLIAYLSTNAAAHINGQVFRINGNRIAILPDPIETNRINKEQGLWTIEELEDLVPKIVLQGYKNPA